MKVATRWCRREGGVFVSADVEETVNLPAQPATWIWAARQTQLAVFRNDGTELAPISYGNDDERFVPDGRVNR